MSGPLRASRSGVRLLVHAQPGARRDEVAGLHGDRLKVRVRAPPEDGRANERLIVVLAEVFRLRRADVLLAAGATSRSKEFILGEMTLETAQERLQELLARAPPAPDG